MNGTIAKLHLNVVQRFPRALSWIPPRRRNQVRTGNPAGPHTWVLARDEARFHAWLGQNVPAAERKGYAYLADPEELEGFRGPVLVLPGAWRRTDAAPMVDAIEKRVHCGAVRWAA